MENQCDKNINHTYSITRNIPFTIKIPENEALEIGIDGQLMSKAEPRPKELTTEETSNRQENTLHSVESWPLFSQDVQTDIATSVDIRMKTAWDKTDDWRLIRIWVPKF